MLPKRRFKEGVAELAVVIVSMEGIEDVKDAFISLWGLMSEVGEKWTAQIRETASVNLQSHV